MSLSLFFIFVVLTLGFPCECRKAEHKKNQPRFVQSKNDKRKGDIGDIPFWEEVDAVINHPKNVLKVSSKINKHLEKANFLRHCIVVFYNKNIQNY